jgi:hypothetical protein
MLATGCGWRYLYPLTMLAECMLKMIHFLAVTWERVTSRSMFSRLGQCEAGSFIWMGCGRTAFVSSGCQSLSAASAFELIARYRMNDSGLSSSGRRWKMVLWKSVVSYRRCFLLWGSGYSAIVCSFFKEKTGRKDRRDLEGGEDSVFGVWVLFRDGMPII